MNSLIIKKLLVTITVPVIAGTIGLLLMATVFCIPTERIYNHVEQSLPMLVDETEHRRSFSVTPTVAGSNVDNYTEEIYLNEALISTKDTSLLSCILSGCCFQKGSTISPLTDLCSTFDEGNVSILPPSQYRFFNGYQIFVKPLLLLTDYSGIRQINLFVSIFLFVLLCKLMNNRGLSKYIFPTLISILFINPLTVAITMSFVGFYYCMIVPCIVILVLKKETIKKYSWLIFSIIGACAFIFNMNYFQLLTFTMPLMFYFLICGVPKKYKEFFNLVISLFVFWFIGYAGTMIFKWVVYAVTLKHEMFNDMLHHIFLRTGTDVGSRKYGVYANLKEAFGNIWWNITEIAFITYIVIKCVKDRTRVQINGTKVCLLLIIGGIILCRYLVFSNHVTIHFWVTYRLLMAPILTFNLIIAGIGEQYETGNS